MVEQEIPAEIREGIRAVLGLSPVPEDPLHGENTLFWLLHLEPEAPLPLRLAALGHDIDRAIPPRTRRDRYPDYDSFKAAHARRSAILLTTLLQGWALTREVVSRTGELVINHECGGDPESDLLADADSISFFDVNLPHYLQREGWEEGLRRARWGWQRLSPRGKEAVGRLRHRARSLNQLLDLVRGAG